MTGEGLLEGHKGNSSKLVCILHIKGWPRVVTEHSKHWPGITVDLEKVRITSTQPATTLAGPDRGGRLQLSEGMCTHVHMLVLV
jgi:hypothetical protein